MWVVLDTLSSYLNSSIFVLLFTLAMCFLLFYKLGMFKKIFLNQDKRIEAIEGIKKAVIESATKLDLIYQNTNPNALIKSHSPISLTESGREIVQEIDAEKIFESHQVQLIGMIEDQGQKNAYDIQEHSFSVAKNRDD